MSYVHLHLHTDYSILDGLGKIKDYVRRAKELGMDAIAITDHGVGYGLDDFYDECKAGGIKPILGCEFYVAPADRKLKEPVDGESYYHLILLVKNETGYRNLCKLITRSNTEGFYKKPRIDFSLLKQFHDGLICTSACVAGEVSKKILRGDVEGAEETALKYRDLFGDDYYLEIQKHGIMDEARAFQIIIQMARKYDIPLICTNDCHYVYPEDKEAHDWLLCMQTKNKLDDPERMHYEGDYSLRSEEEMRSLFPNLPDAFDNTVKIADKCNFDFTYAHKPSDYRMPKVIIPPEYGKDYFRYMSDEAYKGLDWRYPEGHSERQQAETQLEYELSIIKQMGFAKYFLDTRKTIMWARSHDVLVGPGRGSGAGSVNNYCLGITDIDPIKYHLIFERFLNPERISMPDIDVDYEFDRKDDVIKSEAESNGLDHFSKIQTFTAMLPKGALKACVRVAGLPPKVGDHFSKMIPNDAKSLEEAMQLNPDLKEEIEANEDYKKIWDIATKIQGTKSAVSTHACGHIPTPVPCEDLYPCSVDKKTGYLVCQYNMAEVEHLGNLKKDLLMLRNLTVISYARNELKKKGIDVPLWNEEILNDKETLAMLSRGETMGVFQLEGSGITQFIKELRPDSFEDIIAGVSLYRPGPMDFIPQYVQGKHHPETIHYLVPQLEHILEPTYGVIVYQEQVMQIVRDLAGFSMGRADVVRKAMGKKKMDIMLAEKKNFIYGNEELNILGCIKNGISEENAETIYNQMIDFAKYAFNKSHAAAYAAISMETAYLKCHYPVVYMAGLMTSVSDKTDKLVKYVAECRKTGIQILSPDINSSGVGFTVEGEGIRFGLNAVKKVGDAVSEEAVDERNKNGRYESVIDFIERNPDLNSGAMVSLANAGAFPFGYTRNSLATYMKSVYEDKKKESKNQVEGQMSMFDLAGFSKADEDADYFRPLPEYDKEILLKKEKEATGMYLSGHPLDEYAEVLDEEDTIEASDLAKETDDEGNIISNGTAKDGQKATFGGMVTERRIVTTKKGELMAFVTVEGRDGQIDVVVFPKTYQECKQLIGTDDAKVLVKGTVSLSEDKNNSILADSITVLRKPTRNLWLHLKDKQSYYDCRDRVMDMVANNQGYDNLLIVIDDYDGDKKIRNMERIADADSLKSYLSKEFGEDNVAITKAKLKKPRC